MTHARRLAVILLLAGCAGGATYGRFERFGDLQTRCGVPGRVGVGNGDAPGS